MYRYCLIALFFLLCGCTSVFLHPTKGRLNDPGTLGLKYQETLYQDGKGPGLIVWDIPASAPYLGTILFLHGNAENVSTHMRSVTWFPAYGYRVILFDYRGYGGSEGSASLSGAHDDTQRMFDYLKTIEPDKSKRFLFGQSLGASIALYTANKPENCDLFSKIIVDSPFSSYRRIAREKIAQFWLLYPFQYPLSFLISDSYSPRDNLENITVPILYLHGENDLIVPAEHTEELCALNQKQCTRWTSPTAAHIELLHSFGNRQRLVAWLSKP